MKVIHIIVRCGDDTPASAIGGLLRRVSTAAKDLAAHNEGRADVGDFWLETHNDAVDYEPMVQCSDEEHAAVGEAWLHGG